MKLYIKNMVCSRCKMVVSSELEKAGLTAKDIQLGLIDLEQIPSISQMERLTLGLNEMGFELIDDYKSRLIEQIKTYVIELVHHSAELPQKKLSVLISERLKHEYAYLSNLFSSIEGKTIEKYYISQKIEKAKELIIYNQLTLSEIAYQLKYSSVAHLSAQFKMTTGMTTTAFKQLQGDKRRNIEDL